MAAGKRREERERVWEQAMWVWAVVSDAVSPWGVGQYMQRGRMPSEADNRMPHDPEVERKAAEIARNGGKVVF